MSHDTPSRFLAALKRQPVDSTPVWMMRQAGRYLPEYRKLRHEIGSFLKMCKNPDVASEITLQPLARFDLDAAIIFSDILTIPDAMGLGLSFETKEGPQFAFPVRDAAAVQRLPIPDPEQELRYVMDAIRQVRAQTTLPLIGFCGSPWTVATYMVEGKSSKTFSIIKKMLYREPALLRQLLDKLTKASCLYLKAQIEAGAQVVMVFDTWGGILSPSAYCAFSLYFMEQIVHFVKAFSSVPVILFAKQVGYHLEQIAKTGTDAIGIDWTIDLAHARRRVGHQVAIQGNLDPCVLYATSETVQKEVQALLAQWGPHPGHVFNLGHGIYPDIPIENVQAMIQTIREHSAALYKQEKG